VWLDPARTSPYAFYQYWVNVDDRDIGTYMRWFTTWERDEIETLDATVATSPEAREAQRRLALDVTARVHGEAAAQEAVAVSKALFQREPIGDPALLAAVFVATGAVTVTPEIAAAGAVVLLAETGLAASRGEARRLVQGGAVTVNGVRIADPVAALPGPVAGEWFEVRVGKRNRSVVRLVPG
jgi:tyrosyl-tRNA synthetase